MMIDVYYKQTGFKGKILAQPKQWEREDKTYSTLNNNHEVIAIWTFFFRGG